MNSVLVVLGALLVASPFVAVIGLAIKDLGLKAAVGIVLLTVAVIGVLLGGFALIGAGT